MLAQFSKVNPLDKIETQFKLFDNSSKLTNFYNLHNMYIHIVCILYTSKIT
jgi:hypothetical protein